MKEKEEMGRWKRERKEGGGGEGKDRLFYVHIVKRWYEELVLFPFFFLKIMSGDY